MGDRAACGAAGRHAGGPRHVRVRACRAPAWGGLEPGRAVRVRRSDADPRLVGGGHGRRGRRVHRSPPDHLAHAAARGRADWLRALRPARSHQGPPQAVMVEYGDADPNGLASMIGGLIEANLAADPSRGRLLSPQAVGGIEARDADVGWTGWPSPSNVLVSNGLNGRPAVVGRAG